MTENKPSSEKRIKIDPFYPRLVAAGLLAAAGAYFFVPYRGPVSALFLAVRSARRFGSTGASRPACSRCSATFFIPPLCAR